MVQSNHWDTTSQMASHQSGLAFQVPTKTAWRLEILLMILGFLPLCNIMIIHQLKCSQFKNSLNGAISKINGLL